MINEIINEMFTRYWSGDDTKSSIEKMRAQLYKNLKNQLDGYWSGSSAYKIMTNGGFLIDAKSGTKKELTALGMEFMAGFDGEGR
jgi:hypothetical protein